jgi:ATP synthase protein I
VAVPDFVIVFTSTDARPTKAGPDAMPQAPETPRGSGVTVLLRGAAVTVLLGLGAAAVGGLVSGSPAALGALVGTLLVVTVATGGALLVNAVAGVLPTASLLVALLTYLLQLLLVLVGFLALERSGLLGSTLDRAWVGGAAIGAVLVWLATQVALAVGARIPAFDPPAAGAPGATAGRPEGGER